MRLSVDCRLPKNKLLEKIQRPSKLDVPDTPKLPSICVPCRLELQDTDKVFND